MAHRPQASRSLRREPASTFSNPPPSNAKKQLAYLARNLSPNDFHSKFLDMIEGSKRDYAHEALLRALEVLNFDVDGAKRASAEDLGNIERHCARCHTTYKEIDNGLDACSIEHVEGVPHVVDHLPNRLGIWYACCQIFLEPNQSFLIPCSVDRHTGQCDRVSYNGENIITCEEMGCLGHEIDERDLFLLDEDDNGGPASPYPGSSCSGNTT